MRADGGLKGCGSSGRTMTCHGASGTEAVFAAKRRDTATLFQYGG